MVSGMRRLLLGGACLVAVVGVAGAQTSTSYASAQTAPDLITTPPTAVTAALSDTDSANLQTALAAAKRGDVSGARMAMDSLQDPIARKIAQRLTTGSVNWGGWTLISWLPKFVRISAHCGEGW